MTAESRVTLPTTLALPAFAGGLAALAGTYWDDAWHTDRGRDDFFIAPHLTLYGGVLVAALVVGLWLARNARAAGLVTAIRANGPLRWAAIGAGAVFVSAPLDNAWHAAYGRDAVLFSPPHLLAIVASATLIIGLAGGLGPRTEPTNGLSVAVRLAAATGVLGALLVPIMEYEADVPQFSPAWFLPIVTVAVVLARPVGALVLGGRWPLTQAAAVYTIVRIGFVAGLAAAGFSTPIVPPVLLAAVVADLVAARRWPWPAQAAAVTAAVHLAYVPWLALLPHGVPVTGDHLVTSLVVAPAAAAAVHLATRPTRGRPRVPAMSAAGLVLVAVGLAGAAEPASAHDPGQGEPRGDAELVATVEDRMVRLDTAVTGTDCDRLTEATIVARRAGMMRSAPMQLVQTCTYVGYVSVPEDGRWFVYATFDTPDRTLETWLPLEVADGTQASATRILYQPPARSGGANQALVGALLIAAAAVLLGGSLRAVGTYSERAGFGASAQSAP